MTNDETCLILLTVLANQYCVLVSINGISNIYMYVSCPQVLVDILLHKKVMDLGIQSTGKL